jgi:hypothetical protein
MKYTPSGDHAKSYISAPVDRHMCLTLHDSLSSRTSSSPNAGFGTCESGTQITTLPSSPAEARISPSRISYLYLPVNNAGAVYLLVPIGPHLQLDCGGPLYTGTRPFDPRLRHQFSIAMPSQQVSQHRGCPFNSTTYPNIVISTPSCQATFAMRLEICRIYWSVLLVPVDNDWCRLHRGERRMHAAVEALQSAAAGRNNRGGFEADEIGDYRRSWEMEKVVA